MAEIKMKLAAWQTPNFANLALPPGKREDGWQETPSIPITDLNTDALDDLVSDWIAEVYKKAKKAPGWLNSRAIEG